MASRSLRRFVESLWPVAAVSGLPLNSGFRHANRPRQVMRETPVRVAWNSAVDFFPTVFVNKQLSVFTSMPHRSQYIPSISRDSYIRPSRSQNEKICQDLPASFQKSWWISFRIIRNRLLHLLGTFASLPKRSSKLESWFFFWHTSFRCSTRIFQQQDLDRGI